MRWKSVVTLAPAPWNTAGLKNAMSPAFIGSCTLYSWNTSRKSSRQRGDEAGVRELRERQQHRRARLERHVGVGDRALQRQRLRHQVHMAWEAVHVLRGVEPDVVVAMW